MNTQTQKEIVVELPEGFTARSATENDLESVMMLFNRWCRSVTGRDELTDLNALRNDLKSPGFDIEQDTRVIFAPNGQLAGYIEAWTNGKPPVHPWILGRVDPDYEDKGIGTWLMQWTEQRVLHALPNVPTELRVAPRAGTYREAEKPKKLLENMGYHYIRSYYQMLIEMDAPVPEAEFPDGITLRTYRPGADAEAAYHARTDSFRDHFGFVDEPFEDGLKRFKHFWEDESSDPTLLFLAMDGDEVAAINFCRP